MNRENVTEIVAHIVSGILECEPSAHINRESHEEWDSLNHVDIIFTLEEEFQFEFPREAIADLTSVASLVESVLLFLATKQND